MVLIYHLCFRILCWFIENGYRTNYINLLHNSKVGLTSTIPITLNVKLIYNWWLEVNVVINFENEF